MVSRLVPCVLALAVLGTAGEVPCPPVPRPIPASIIKGHPKVVEAVARVNELWANMTKTNKLPGLIGTVVYDQEPLLAAGYGKRNASDPSSPPPQPHDLVRVASITKVFTDILMFQLRDEGKIDLDTPLERVLPGFRVRRVGETKGVVTLRNLASHTSGLPREVPYPCSWGGNCSEERVLDLLSEKVAVLPPNRRFHYSNLGIALLGRALGHVAGAEYESLVAEKILHPLGMANATFKFNETTRQRMAVGFENDGRVAVIDAIGWAAPCGGLWASATDLQKLMMMMFRDDRPRDGETQILDGDTVHEMLNPAVLLGDGMSAVGSPWEEKYTSRVWARSKQGELSGYRSSVSVVQELKIGVFTSALQTDVAENTVWSVPALDILVPAIEGVMWEHQQPRPLPSMASQFVGKYHPDAEVTQGNAYALKLVLSGRAYNLTSSTLPPYDTSSLVVHALESGMGCRWLDDGPEFERVYFQISQSAPSATGFIFMGNHFTRVV